MIIIIIIILNYFHNNSSTNRPLHRIWSHEWFNGWKNCRMKGHPSGMHWSSQRNSSILFQFSKCFATCFLVLFFIFLNFWKKISENFLRSAQDKSMNGIEGHARNNCFLHSFFRALARSFIHSFIRSFVRSFVRSFIHSFIHSFTYPLIHPLIHFTL